MRQRIEDRQRSSSDALEGRLLDTIIQRLPQVEMERKRNPIVQMVSASAIAPARVEWLWPGRIPLGMLVLFSGDPKLGKSLAALSLIAAVTRGGPLPGADGPAMAPLGSAILLSAEDDPARTIVPRLQAAGADLDRVHILPAMLEPDIQGLRTDPGAGLVGRERMPTLSADDLEAIERSAAALGDCRLIVFDPISAYLGRGADVRRALAPLGDMAKRLAATIALINHLSKRGASSTNGKYRVRDSIEYVATCRTNFLFLADPDDPSGRRRLMLDNGRNLGTGQAALPFIIRDEGAGPFCDWLPETIDLDADAALARAVKAGKSDSSGIGARRRECEGWLRGYLALGPRPAKECEQAATEAGFSSSILRRAREDLAVRCVRLGFGKGGCSHWCLPGTAVDEPEHPESDMGDHTCRADDHTCHAHDLTSMPSMPSMGDPSDGRGQWTAPAGDEGASGG